MKVSGFTFIRNGTLLGYPYVESIKSILPICDEFIVVVGRSQDDTLAKIRGIKSKKIRIIETIWNENISDRGFVYAQQKMIAQYNCTGDWAFYLEGDEIVNEKDLSSILSVMRKNLNNQDVEALAFDYLHFYGSPKWLAKSPAWYRQECRIIRNTIRTWNPDSLYFMVMDKNKKGRYPKAVLIEKPIYHYGHVRKIQFMNQKMSQVGKYWGHNHKALYKYEIDSKALIKFQGKHPELIKNWLKKYAEKDFDLSSEHILTSRERKHRFSMFLERLFNIDLTKKHFTLINK
jgi:glycosyltransferase involved in cell wall biosynthesis